MRKIIIIFVLLLAFSLIYGCTVSVNPMDLNPSNNYSIFVDNNSLNNASQNPVTLTSEEVVQHNFAKNCWMIINNNVYDLSTYVNHPGGSVYVPYCGSEATQGYNTRGGRGGSHSQFADYLLSSYLVGELGQDIIIKDLNIQINNNQKNIPQNQHDNDFEEEDDD